MDRPVRSAGEDARAGESLSFKPRYYEKTRRAGLEAYSAFRAALSTSDAVAPQVLESLPPPSEDLELGELAMLAGSVVWGELRRFYHEPSDPVGEAESAPLRDWYDRIRLSLNRFFPEHQREWTEKWPSLDSPEFWSELERRTRAVAAESGRGADGACALFVLVRDAPAALAPAVEALGGDNDQLIEFLLNSSGGSIDAAREREGDLLDLIARRRGDFQPGRPYVGFWALLQLEDLSVEEVLSEASRVSLDSIMQRAGVLEGATRSRALDIRKRAISDLPARVDMLGVKPLVRGLYELLDDPETTLPLSVGLTAPWGAGKSSVMVQLRALLDETETRNRSWVTVAFDAWKYERSERLWAAMAKAIYDRALEVRTPLQQARFRLALQHRRRGGWGFFTRYAAPFLVMLAVCAVLLLVTGELVLPAAAAGVAAVLFGEAVRSSGAITDPFRRAIANYTAKPDYEGALGFTSEADEDVGHLTAEMTKESVKRKWPQGKRTKTKEQDETKETCIAVFVDDLDRCDNRAIVEMITAINQIFNAGYDRRCAFVLGMDREVVAASLEVGYADTIDALGKRGEHFGLSFLEKVVQLSVAIPEPAAEDLEALLNSITGYVPEEADAEDPNAPSVEELARDLRVRSPRDPADAERIAEELRAGLTPEEHTVAYSKNLDEAERIVRSEFFGADSPEVSEAERIVMGHLRSNPRDLKRFDNAFRLQLHVANGTPGCDLDFDLDDLVALGKWVVLRLRWPGFAAAVDADEGLLARSEHWANAGAGATPSRGAAPACMPEDPELAALLEEPESQRWISRLDEHEFLRVS